MADTTQHDTDEIFGAIIADAWYGPSSAVTHAATGAGRRLWLLRVGALLATVLCAVAVVLAFGVGVAAGVTVLAFSPVAVLASVLTLDRLLGD